MKPLVFGADVSSIEIDKDGKPIRNKWQWRWMEETNSEGQVFQAWCRKIDQPGKCICVACNTTLTYGSAGKKALMRHANHVDHIRNVTSLHDNSKISGATATFNTKDSIQDRANEVKSIIGMFIAEHCLPFALGPELLELGKRLSKDVPALSSTTLSRTSTSYTIGHGVAHELKRNLKERLENKFFSLNVDEATSNAGNKILNVMVSFYDDDAGKVVCQLLGSRVMEVSTATTIVSEIEDVFEKFDLKWSQVVSVLSDNCNVMRGVKEGVETRLRRKNNNLLNVGGDTVHLVNNAAKKYFQPVEANFFNLQCLASDLYYDIEDSPKIKNQFRALQLLLQGTTLSVIRPIPNRFLQMGVVTDRLWKLWDALTLFYSAYLPDSERKLYQPEIDSILAKYKLSSEDSYDINQLLKGFKKGVKTDAGKARQEKILLAIFNRRAKAEIVIHLYRGVTKSFQEFVKKFQHNKPLAYELHSSMFDLVKTFYASFIKPENIPSDSVSKLLKIDINDSNLQVRDRQLGVGEYCTPYVIRWSKDKVRHGKMLKEFFDSVRKGCIAAAMSLKKLPLENEQLSYMAYLSPAFQLSSHTLPALSKLAEKLPNVISLDELGGLDQELRRYSTDSTITGLDVDETSKEFQIDKDWWAPIFCLKVDGQPKYPLLGRLVKAVLSVFSGPIVEGSFNIMDDIIENDRCSLTAFNYEALAFIKSHMSANGHKAVSYPITDMMKNSVGHSYGTYMKYLDAKKPSEAASSSSTKPKPPVSSSNIVVSTSSVLSSSSTHSAVPLDSSSSKSTPLPISSFSTSTTTTSTSTMSPEQPSPTLSSSTPCTLPPPAMVTNSTQQQGKRKQAPLFAFFPKRAKPNDC